MKKVIKLKESDIQRIVKRTLNEQDYGDKETVKNELLERIREIRTSERRICRSNG